MPIYEYACKACDHRFEALVRGQQTLACPSCGKRDLQRLLSVSGVQTPGTKAKGLKAAKQRDAAQATDRMHDRLHYERSHDRHG